MLSQRGVIQCYCFTVLTLAKCSHFWNQLCKSHTGVMPPKWHVGWGRRFGGRWMRNARVFLMSRMVIGADFDGHGWRKQRWWGRDGDVWCSGQEKRQMVVEWKELDFMLENVEGSLWNLRGSVCQTRRETAITWPASSTWVKLEAASLRTSSMRCMLTDPPLLDFFPSKCGLYAKKPTVDVSDLEQLWCFFFLCNYRNLPEAVCCSSEIRLYCFAMTDKCVSSSWFEPL